MNYPNTTRAGFENSGYGFNCGGLSSFEAGFFSTYPNGSKAEGLKGTKGDLDIAESCDGAFHKPGRGPAAH